MNNNILRRGKIVALHTLHPILLFRLMSYNTSRLRSDFLSSLGYYNYPHKIIFLAGMAMSATTWMKNLLARIPGYYTRPTPMPYDINYRCDYVDSAFSKVPKHGHTLFKTHLNPNKENVECIFRNGVEKVLITHRDLRDVVLSRYHRLVKFPKPRNAIDFVDYQALGKEKAVNHSIEIVSKLYIPWIDGWAALAKQDPKRYHIVKFEDLKEDTEREFRNVLRFYGIKLSDKEIKNIIKSAKGKKNVKTNIAEARFLPWGLSSNFRSGKIGTWRDELTHDQIEKCKKLLGSTLIKYGYEKDLNW